MDAIAQIELVAVVVEREQGQGKEPAGRKSLAGNGRRYLRTSLQLGREGQEKLVRKAGAQQRIIEGRAALAEQVANPFLPAHPAQSRRQVHRAMPSRDDHDSLRLQSGARFE